MTKTKNKSTTLTKAIVTTNVDVRFAETDLMGVVHHAAYIVWFEVGRIEWMKAAGMPYTEIAASGHHFAVTGINAAYRTAVRFGDALELRTHLSLLRSRKVQFTYELIHKATDDQPEVIAATGTSDHICVDLENRMAKIPADVMQRLLDGAEKISHDS